MEQSFRVFIEVVEAKSFSKAAERLYMTQPAVSQYVKSLESQLDAKLLDRSYKKIRPTKAGEIVYEHAKEMVHHQETMEQLIHDLFHEPKGELAIGASYTFGEYVLPRIIASLRIQYPGIHPTVTISNTQEIAELVERMKLDIGIVEGEVHLRGLQVEDVAEDEMKIVASRHHPLAGKEQVSVKELEQAMWITREVGSGTRAATDKLFEQLSCYPEERMEFGSTQVIKESVEAGIGLSLLSLWTVRKEIEMESLVVIPVEGGNVRRSFSILTRKKLQQTKATQAFKELLRTVISHYSD
ncbi:LysR family transcriptional regulator [Pontibacillus salicampi]|uniref:LysR family transcriptional regulator n=1 Tax=Pontibacillus salicampi TaxID=1449801 RepID=A0ABV6LRR8_9BACI